ncbi:uncharacterized protein LOC126801658 [Argentina anserina]|uniref:uncharacterized protein LOC126801658 n=1 Tax=Argentina anserina TaxID=57926 RepID=UPI0021764C4E|nr:uncharacterized protein LOC126801658 [Potentilla anserina]
MATPTDPTTPRHPKPIANLFSLFAAPKTTPSDSSPIAVKRLAYFFPISPKPILLSPLPPPPQPAAVNTPAPAPASESKSSTFPGKIKVAGLSSMIKGSGPAFVGQVFSMCDLSGTGLMAVTNQFDIPFISQRTPEWLKKMFASATNGERDDGPVFRFFMDLGDAVTYVKRLNIPSGVVGACRLDLAFEHFKQKPHLFQFVPNEKQVRAANKLLKGNAQNGKCIRVDGVPVFSAQNLDIAIASPDGIKWYTPYFFDKNMLDNILEESVDQHFHTLIQTRHMQRRRDVVDDNLAAEVIEEMGDNLWEPPEVQEVMDEIGNPGIPLSVISKAAEMQLHYTVDKVILGNRWLRKATGIQPKFPYMVDTFERRSVASFLRASESTMCLSDSEAVDDHKDSLQTSTSEIQAKDDVQTNTRSKSSHWFPFGDWFSHMWLKQKDKDGILSTQYIDETSQLNVHLPKITMVGISSTGEAGTMSRESVRKTMDDLTKELEQTDPEKASGIEATNEFRFEDIDPLFVANVGDYYSGKAKGGARFRVRE